MAKTTEHHYGTHFFFAFWRSVGVEFSKKCVNVVSRARFFSRGELSVLSGILAFFVLFGGLGRSSGVLARDRMQKVRKCRFSREVSQKVANCRTSRAKRTLF